MNLRIGAAIVVVVVALIATVSLWSGLVGYNDVHSYQIYQSPFGSVSVVDRPGYYYKGFGTVWTYPRALEDEWTQTPTRLCPHDESIRATFNDGGTAQVSAYARVSLPTDAEHRLTLHQQFGGNLESISQSVHAHLANCVKASGPVMSASENQASRKGEFNQIVEEQLVHGLFEMRRTSIELEDLTTIEDAGTDAQGNKVTREKKARVMATEVVRGKDGQPKIIQESPLKQYNIGVLQFSITEMGYDAATLTQFAAKKESFLAAERAKAQRQEEVQQRLMIEEKGRRQVAEIQADENQKKERAMIQAEQAAAVAVIAKTQAVTQAQQRTEVAEQSRLEAVKLKEIADIKAQTAELDKKATISAAEAKQKSIELGGGISDKDRILAEIQANRDAKVAEALAGLKVPGVVIVGGDGKNGGGLTENLLNMALLKSTGVLKDTTPVDHK